MESRCVTVILGISSPLFVEATSSIAFTSGEAPVESISELASLVKIIRQKNLIDA